MGCGPDGRDTATAKWLDPRYVRQPPLVVCRYRSPARGQRYVPPTFPGLRHEDVRDTKGEHGVYIRLGERAMDDSLQRAHQSVAEVRPTAGSIHPRWACLR